MRLFIPVLISFCLWAVPCLADCDVQGLLNMSSAFDSTCRVPPNSLLTLHAIHADTNATALYARFHNTAVEQGGAVALIGEPGGTLAIHFEVSNVIFRQGAAIRVSGYFPLHSNVTIHSNIFECTAENTALPDLGGLIVPILIGDGSDVTLMPFTTLSISQNTIVASSNIAGAEVDGISFRSNILLQQYSTIYISQNTIEVYGSPASSWANGIDFFRTLFVQGNHSQYIISSNTIRGTYASAISLPPIFATKDLCRCKGDASMQIAVRENTIQLNNSLNDNSIFYVGFVLLSSDASLEISNNNATVFNMNGYMELYDDVTAGDNSTIAITGNRIVTHAGNPELYVTVALRARANGQVRIDSNTFYRADDKPADWPYMYFNGDMEVWDAARLSISNNIADYALRTMEVPNGSTAPPRSTPGLITIVDGHTEGSIFYPVIVGVDPAASFVCCHNMYVGVPIDSDSRLRASVSEALYQVISPVDRCPAEPTDVVGVTEPTAPNTTTAEVSESWAPPLGATFVYTSAVLVLCVSILVL